MPKFVDNTYFGQITALMLEKGFALFAHVQLSKEEGFQYHVEAPHARDTSLFFHYPNKTLIISLNYHEHSAFGCGTELYSEQIEGHWTIRFYHQFVDERTLAELTYVPFDQRKDPWDCDADFRSIMFRGLNPEPKHFTWRGGGEMCELYGSVTPTVPETIIGDIWLIAEALLPYLGGLPFDELQVTSFPPYYTFPGCEAQFWERFKTSISSRYLWSLVRRPWGSDGLKR